MKIKIFTLIIMCFSTHLSAITHQKMGEPLVATINTTKEEAWHRLLELLVANAVPIKFSDKKTGIIQTEVVGFSPNCSLKTDNNTKSWAVFDAVLDADSLIMFPQVVYGELRMSVQETAENKVEMRLDFMNISAFYHDSKLNRNIKLEIESTKVLERSIANFVETTKNAPRMAFTTPFFPNNTSPSQVTRDAKALREKIINDAKRRRSTNIIGIALVALILFPRSIFGL